MSHVDDTILTGKYYVSDGRDGRDGPDIQHRVWILQSQVAHSPTAPASLPRITPLHHFTKARATTRHFQSGYLLDVRLHTTIHTRFYTAGPNLMRMTSSDYITPRILNTNSMWMSPPGVSSFLCYAQPIIWKPRSSWQLHLWIVNLRWSFWVVRVAFPRRKMAGTWPMEVDLPSTCYSGREKSFN
jgi:hypothetical protein